MFSILGCSYGALLSSLVFGEGSWWYILLVYFLACLLACSCVVPKFLCTALMGEKWLVWNLTHYLFVADTVSGSHFSVFLSARLKHIWEFPDWAPFFLLSPVTLYSPHDIVLSTWHCDLLLILCFPLDVVLSPGCCALPMMLCSPHDVVLPPWRCALPMTLCSPHYVVLAAWHYALSMTLCSRHDIVLGALNALVCEGREGNLWRLNAKPVSIEEWIVIEKVACKVCIKPTAIFRYSSEQMVNR